MVSRSLALIALAIALTSSARAQISPSYGTPPDTWEGLVAESVAVVRGRVEGRRFVNDSSWGTPMTEYFIRVLETIKGDGRFNTGDRIGVYRFGGAQNARVIADKTFAPFDNNDEVLLFLERGASQSYTPAFGAAGAFKMQDGYVRPFSQTRFAKTQDGKPSEEVLNNLRKSKK